MSLILPRRSALILGGAAAAAASTPARAAVTTWNPNDKSSNITLSNGNLTATLATGAQGGVRSSTSIASGKAYFEVTLVSVPTSGVQNLAVGIVTSSFVLASGGGIGGDLDSIGMYPIFAMQTYLDNVVFDAGPAGGGVDVAGDIISVAVDLTNLLFWWTSTKMIAQGNAWNNRTLANSNPATGVGGDSMAGMSAGPYYIGYCDGFIPSAVTLNAGASAFSRAVPSGYTAWNGSSLLCFRRERTGIFASAGVVAPVATGGNPGGGGGGILQTPAAVGAQVYVNASKQLTTPLPAAMWGQSMENNNGTEPLWAGIQPTAQSLNLPFVRIMWKHGDGYSMGAIFPDANSAGVNWTGVDTQIGWIKNNCPGNVIVKLDPEYPPWYSDGLNIRLGGTDAQLQAQYRILVQRFYSAGLTLFAIEGPGEWQAGQQVPVNAAKAGTIAHIARAGARQVDTNIKLSAPGEAWLSQGTSALQNGWFSTNPDIDMGSWDNYYGGGLTTAQQQTAMDGMYGDMAGGTGSTILGMRNFFNGNGLSSIPLISAEFNQDSDDTGVNGLQGNIAYVATHLHALVNSGCNVMGACYWHMHNWFLNASDWSLFPMAFYYKYAIANMPGTLVDKSIGSGVSGNVLVMPSRSGASGSRCSIQIINKDLTNASSISLQLVGWLGGNVTQWQSNPASPSGVQNSVTQASLGSLALPASSVTIITGTVA